MMNTCVIENLGVNGIVREYNYEPPKQKLVILWHGIRIHMKK